MVQFDDCHSRAVLELPKTVRERPKAVRGTVDEDSKMEPITFDIEFWTWWVIICKISMLDTKTICWSDIFSLVMHLRISLIIHLAYFMML